VGLGIPFKAGWDISDEFAMLPENGGKGFVKRSPIVGSEDAESANDQIRLDGGDDRFDDRWFQQSGRPPFDDSRLTDSGRGPNLARDGHENDVRPFAVVCLGADDDGRAPLGRRLIRERKRNHDHITKGEPHGIGYSES